jgi:hypothetical protein
MTEQDWLAERFDEHRARLRSVAYRLLGSLHEADDALQESWLRLSRSDTSDVANLRGWPSCCLEERPDGVALPGQVHVWQRTTCPDRSPRAARQLLGRVR